MEHLYFPLGITIAHKSCSLYAMNESIFHISFCFVAIFIHIYCFSVYGGALKRRFYGMAWLVLWNRLSEFNKNTINSMLKMLESYARAHTFFFVLLQFFLRFAIHFEMKVDFGKEQQQKNIMKPCKKYKLSM